ncbi:hypothetical protein DERF_005839 [Dermatophagoides farinae]|uniref:Uncharacterized protein n=1 Tax=Dermatophagoides farinae TaxID=6954 RepID=A0A922L6K9_DERFA|nr:uncharacterized protein LOC124490173 [Dermatophagoides farinae]KAH7639206.1 hypothetical protein HUG17_3239 [Dermatophagoides farinae]KAH9522251.1 hypothetical protein DERF_005839 [Dermatophagoides farinae]
MLSSLLIFTIFSTTVWPSSSSSSTLTCTETNLANADLCGEKLFFVGKNSRPFPVNETELNDYCNETIQLIKCVRKFTEQCAKNSEQKQLANVMLYTVRSLHRSTCGSKTKRLQLLHMSSCVNSLRKQSSHCMNQMLIRFGQALGLQQQNNRIPYGCCSFHRMKSCVLEHAERQPKYCDSKSIEYFDQYISNMAGNTLQLMCSDYDGDSDRCQRINRLSYDISKIILPKSILKAFGNLLLLSSDFQTV